jgi:CRISPR-associated protein Csx16
MVKRLITFLGMGDYKLTKYRLGPDCVQTCYVARALSTFLQPEETSVFATDLAWSKHGGSLTSEFQGASLPQPRHVPIGAGETSEELWHQFELLFDELDCGGEVAFDITHGFRAQPFFASAVIQLFQSVNPGCPPLKVYYGAFDEAKGESPIWDLTAFVELLDWSRALLLFLRTGRADDIAQPTEQLGKALGKQWADGNLSGSPPSLASLGRALQEFGDDFVTLRTGTLIARRKSSARKLLDALGRAKTEVATHIPPLAKVLHLVDDLVRPLAGSPRLSQPNGQRALQSLAESYFSMGRYAEAAATVREGWITRYACDQADLSEGETFREIRRKAAEHTWSLREAERIGELRELRNDIEHAGFRCDPKPPRTIKEGIEKAIVDWRSPPSGATTVPAPAGIIYYDIGAQQQITPGTSLPEPPEIPRGTILVIEGRAPAWRYTLALDRARKAGAEIVAIRDPEFGPVVVSSNDPVWPVGRIADSPPERQQDGGAKMDKRTPKV